VRLIVFRSFYAFRHRFHRVDISSTAANATTQTDLLLRDHRQKWDLWIQHRRSAEKVPNQAKQLYIRLTGSRALQTDTPARRNCLPLVPVTSE
jgi:hypothetical protein